MISKFKFKELSIADARRWCEDVESLDEAEFNLLRQGWYNLEVSGVPEEYLPLRESICKLFKSLGGTTIESTKMSPIDIHIGLELYEELGQLGFSVTDATNDDVWRFISVKVFPDITYCRYPTPEKAQREKGQRINQKRFFSGKWRIWLKTLWWYIYLSWQGTSYETKAILEGNGSNTLSHFIETPGRGHRVDCNRMLMKEYARRKPRVTPKMFDAAMKLYGAECRVVEPALTSGGVAGYCRRLFDTIERQYNRKAKQ